MKKIAIRTFLSSVILFSGMAEATQGKTRLQLLEKIKELVDASDYNPDDYLSKTGKFEKYAKFIENIQKENKALRRPAPESLSPRLANLIAAEQSTQAQVNQTRDEEAFKANTGLIIPELHEWLRNIVINPQGNTTDEVVISLGEELLTTLNKIGHEILSMSLSWKDNKLAIEYKPELVPARLKALPAPAGGSPSTDGGGKQIVLRSNVKGLEQMMQLIKVEGNDRLSKPVQSELLKLLGELWDLRDGIATEIYKFKAEFDKSGFDVDNFRQHLSQIFMLGDTFTATEKDGYKSVVDQYKQAINSSIRMEIKELEKQSLTEQLGNLRANVSVGSLAGVQITKDWDNFVEVISGHEGPKNYNLNTAPLSTLKPDEFRGMLIHLGTVRTLSLLPPPGCVRDFLDQEYKYNPKVTLFFDDTPDKKNLNDGLIREIENAKRIFNLVNEIVLGRSLVLGGELVKRTEEDEKFIKDTFYKDDGLMEVFSKAFIAPSMAFPKVTEWTDYALLSRSMSGLNRILLAKIDKFIRGQLGSMLPFVAGNSVDEAITATINYIKNKQIIDEMKRLYDDETDHQSNFKPLTDYLPHLNSMPEEKLADNFEKEVLKFVECMFGNSSLTHQALDEINYYHHEGILESVTIDSGDLNQYEGDIRYFYTLERWHTLLSGEVLEFGGKFESNESKILERLDKDKKGKKVTVLLWQGNQTTGKMTCSTIDETDLSRIQQQNRDYACTLEEWYFARKRRTSIYTAADKAKIKSQVEDDASKGKVTVLLLPQYRKTDRKYLKDTILWQNLINSNLDVPYELRRVMLNAVEREMNADVLTSNAVQCHDSLIATIEDMRKGYSGTIIGCLIKGRSKLKADIEHLVNNFGSQESFVKAKIDAFYSDPSNRGKILSNGEIESIFQQTIEFKQMELLIKAVQDIYDEINNGDKFIFEYCVKNAVLLKSIKGEQRTRFEALKASYIQALRNVAPELRSKVEMAIDLQSKLDEKQQKKMYENLKGMAKNTGNVFLWHQKCREFEKTCKSLEDIFNAHMDINEMKRQVEEFERNYKDVYATYAEKINNVVYNIAFSKMKNGVSLGDDEIFKVNKAFIEYVLSKGDDEKKQQLENVLVDSQSEMEAKKNHYVAQLDKVDGWCNAPRADVDFDSIKEKLEQLKINVSDIDTANVSATPQELEGFVAELNGIVDKFCEELNKPYKTTGRTVMQDIAWYFYNNDKSVYTKFIKNIQNLHDRIVEFNEDTKDLKDRVEGAKECFDSVFNNLTNLSNNTDSFIRSRKVLTSVFVTLNQNIKGLVNKLKGQAAQIIVDALLQNLPVMEQIKESRGASHRKKILELYGKYGFYKECYEKYIEWLNLPEATRGDPPFALDPNDKEEFNALQNNHLFDSPTKAAFAEAFSETLPGTADTLRIMDYTPILQATAENPSFSAVKIDGLEEAEHLSERLQKTLTELKKALGM